jgi:hypothetical protein
VDIVNGSISRQTFVFSRLFFGQDVTLFCAVSSPKLRSQPFDVPDGKLPCHDFNPIPPRYEIGPTAYPSVTGQDSSEEKITVAHIENWQQCPDLPSDTPILHPWHPKKRESKLGDLLFLANQTICFLRFDVHPLDCLTFAVSQPFFDFFRIVSCFHLSLFLFSLLEFS